MLRHGLVREYQKPTRRGHHAVSSVYTVVRAELASDPPAKPHLAELLMFRPGPLRHPLGLYIPREGLPDGA